MHQGKGFILKRAASRLIQLPIFPYRIVKEQGVSRIENFMYEDHEMLKRASVQAMNNLLFNEEVVKMYEGKNDRTKYLFLLGTAEDLELAKAATGGLAILTSVSKRASRKLFEVKFTTINVFISEDTRFGSTGWRVEGNYLLLAEPL